MKKFLDFNSAKYIIDLVGKYFARKDDAPSGFETLDNKVHSLEGNLTTENYADAKCTKEYIDNTKVLNKDGTAVYQQRNGGGDVSFAANAGSAAAFCSFASGYLSEASGDYSHAEGNNTKAKGECSHAEGSECVSAGDFSHAEGSSTKANTDNAHAEGLSTTAGGVNSHAEGEMTKANGTSSHAEGLSTTASGNYSHAEGQSTSASGVYSHAEGYSTRASSSCTHAEGRYTEAKGLYSHAQGGGVSSSKRLTASGYYSHAEGYGTLADSYALHVQGCFNSTFGEDAKAFDIDAAAFVIGNGSSDTYRSNAFRVDFNGDVSCAGQYMNNGADYAEFFEWADGNPENDDRIGHFVAIADDGKITIAQSADDVIGVVSGISSVVGNASEDNWSGRYMRDAFGRLLYVDVDVDVEIEHVDEHGNVSTRIETVTEHRLKVNPQYDPTKAYVPRSKRKEWAVVGMFGQLIVIDDGTCKVGGKCTTNEYGTAIPGSKYRVIKRIDDSHIVVLANFL